MRRIVIHPPLFALFPVLSIYVHNSDLVRFQSAVGPLLLVTVSATLIWLFLGLVAKSWRKSAIIVSASVLLFFSYGRLLVHLAQGICRLSVLGASCAPAAVVLLPLLLILGFGCVIFFVIKTSSDLRLTTGYLNVVSLFLVLFALAKWSYEHAQMQGARAFSDAWQDVAAAEALPNRSVADPLPDIYYIIVDAYAREDILAEVYSFDNSAFLDYLTDRGFFVGAASRSNYCQTALSLASSLNFMYLDDLVSQIGSEAQTRRPLAVMIQNSRLTEALSSVGYSTVAFSTGYSITELDGADVFMAPPADLNGFEREVLNNTPLLQLFELFSFRTLHDRHRERIVYTLDHLADASELPSPTFVFAHIVAPHPPFVLGANGEAIRPDDSATLGLFTLLEPEDYTWEEYVQAYTDQLTYVNTKLTTAINDILSRSPSPPVIILQADHGPGPLSDWEKATESGIRGRVSILNAIYLPDSADVGLNSSITPVNTFRVVLNTYLGAEYALLADSAFFSSWAQPYSFTEVPGSLLP
jgi:hypothetical protein